MSLSTLEIRSTFIGLRIAEWLMSDKNVLSSEARAIAVISPQDNSDCGLLIAAYRMSMGEAWSDKHNLFAFRRLLAEFGLEKPPSNEEILTASALQVPSSSLVKSSEVIAAFEAYSNNTVEYAPMPQVVVTLQEAVSQARILWIAQIVENHCKQHMKTLRRKYLQLMSEDDYGVKDKSKWEAEIRYFFDKVISHALPVQSITDNLCLSICAHIDQMVNDASDASEDSFDFQPDSQSPIEFEVYCAERLQCQGWKTRLTVSTGDQGVDVIAERGGIKLVVQCKLYNSAVGNSAVQEINAGRGFYGADIAAVVTNSTFTASARELASTVKVILLHHSDLKDFDRILFGIH